jgi:hypothetical protein
MIFTFCDKEESKSSILNEYISLEAEKDSLMPNETTTITATAEGENLNYLWFSNGGVFIKNNGSSVIFSAPDCSSGNKEISCTVKADNKSETKKVYIYVY